MGFQCSHCIRSYSSSYALKRHISDKHPIINEEEPLTQTVIYEDSTLWEIETLSSCVSDSLTSSERDEENRVVRLSLIEFTRNIWIITD